MDGWMDGCIDGFDHLASTYDCDRAARTERNESRGVLDSCAESPLCNVAFFHSLPSNSVNK